MKKAFFIPLLFAPAVLSAQSKPARILYYLDSMHVAYNPLQYHRNAQGVLEKSETGYVNTVKANGHVLRNVVEMGYDSVMYVFTKAYVERSEADKKIPSTRTLDARWKPRDAEAIYYQNGRPYTGKVTDYHFNGKKEMEGMLENGRRTGIYNYYGEDGQLFRTIAYSKKDGGEEELHADASGRVYEKTFVKGNGYSTYAYYANGTLKSSLIATKEGRVSLSYYSNGKLRDSAFAKRMSRQTKKSGKYWELEHLLMTGKFEEALRLDPGNPVVYLWRAVSLAKTFHFDEAIADIDTAISLEPLEEAYPGHRALLRVRKYAYLRDTAQLEYDYKLIWYLAEHPPLPVPAEEKALILKDLETAMVPGASYYRMKEYEAAYRHLEKE